MGESNTLVFAVNCLIFAGFLALLISLVSSGFGKTKIEMEESYEMIHAKHIAHMAEYCLKQGKDYIDADTPLNLGSCKIGAKITITDVVTGKSLTPIGSGLGKRNHVIAVNIKSGDEMHVGWLRVEF